jgi:hypothetical protein
MPRLYTPDLSATASPREETNSAKLNLTVAAAIAGINHTNTFLPLSLNFP